MTNPENPFLSTQGLPVNMDTINIGPVSGGEHTSSVQRLSGIIEKIPEPADQVIFAEAISLLPADLQEAYQKRMEGSFKQEDEVAAHTGGQGVLYELRHIAEIEKNGLEELDFEAGGTIGKVTYAGYSKKADLNDNPDKELTSVIDCDVPITRGDKPYVYEVKNYSRMRYGSKASNRNQVLKYEQAVKSNMAEGATVQLKGRLDTSFMEWAIGNSDQPSPIPNVEILYSLDLPSGKEYTLVLKPGPEGKGLKFANPEITDDLDAQMIEGIHAAQADGSLATVVALENFDDVAMPDELKPFMADPMSIKSMEVYKQYTDIRRVAIYEKLLAKAADQQEHLQAA